MATELLESGWDGFSSDRARDQLPKGVAYRLRDYLPNLESPSRKRGGWKFASTDLGLISSSTYLTGMGWYQRPDITTDDHLVVVADNGKVYSVKTYDGTGGTSIGSVNSVVPTKSNPIYTTWGDLLIFPGERASGKTMHKYYWNGSAYALTSVAADATYALGSSWGNVTVLAGNYALPKRVHFSIDSGYTVPTNQWWDMPGNVVGLASIPNVVIVFGNEDTWGLIGSQIPPGGDMQERVLFGGVGCMDPRSIVQSSSYVIWASQTGIYKTDGTAPIDLTYNGGLGIQNFWRDLVAGFKYGDNWSAAAGQYGNRYVISIHDSAGSLQGTLMYDLDRQRWYELTNFEASCYAHKPGSAGTSTATGEEELFFGLRTASRAAKVSPIWTPSSTNAEDGDGMDVLPEVETGYYRLGLTQPKRVRRVWLGYDMRGDNGPEMEVAWTGTPDSQVYTPSPDLLPSTTSHQRLPAEIRDKVLGVAFKLRQTAPSDDTRIYTFEGDGHAFEEFRR